MSDAAIWFRNGDSRFPFLWEGTDQPPARWHGVSEGPACYLADTADGAWAEFLRHEEIDDPADLVGVERRLWAVEVPCGDSEDATTPGLVHQTMRGGLSTYADCQAEARRLRGLGATSLIAPTAALRQGAASGQVVNGGLVEASERDGRVLVLYGDRPQLRGWAAVDVGRPTERVLHDTITLTM